MNGVFLEIIVPTLTTICLFICGLAVKNYQANRKRIQELELAVKELQTQMSPFWASLQTKVADALHHPKIENQTLDGLLEKLESLDLTEEERIALVAILVGMVKHAATDESEKAGAMLGIMPMVVKEAAGELPLTDQRSMWIKKTEH